MCCDHAGADGGDCQDDCDRDLAVDRVDEGQRRDGDGHGVSEKAQLKSLLDRYAVAWVQGARAGEPHDQHLARPLRRACDEAFDLDAVSFDDDNEALYGADVCGHQTTSGHKMIVCNCRPVACSYARSSARIVREAAIRSACSRRLYVEMLLMPRLKSRSARVCTSSYVSFWMPGSWSWS